MTNLEALPLSDESGSYHVVVESPRGSAVKLKWSPALGTFTLSRPLTLGLAYPYDWGFFPSTRSPDGDPLDAMVFWDVASHPGVVLACRPLGVLQLTQLGKQGQERIRNDRLLVAPVKAPRIGELSDARGLPARVLDELAEFFVETTVLTAKQVQVIGWKGPEEAKAAIDDAARRYARR